MEKIYYDNCSGGCAYEEIDHNKYCLGEHYIYSITDNDGITSFVDGDFTDRCSQCPKLLSNNIGKIYGGKTGD